MVCFKEVFVNTVEEGFTNISYHVFAVRGIKPIRLAGIVLLSLLGLQMLYDGDGDSVMYYK